MGMVGYGNPLMPHRGSRAVERIGYRGLNGLRPPTRRWGVQIHNQRDTRAQNRRCALLVTPFSRMTGQLVSFAASEAALVIPQLSRLSNPTVVRGGPALREYARKEVDVDV
jgi:hypothetical protein